VLNGKLNAIVYMRRLQEVAPAAHHSNAVVINCFCLLSPASINWLVFISSQKFTTKFFQNIIPSNFDKSQFWRSIYFNGSLIYL